LCLDRLDTWEEHAEGVLRTLAPAERATRFP